VLEMTGMGWNGVVDNVFVEGVQMSDDVGIGSSNWEGTRHSWVLGMEV
jgi:hypothetical protein